MKYQHIKRGDEGYPELLSQIHSAPKELYIWGEIPQAKHWVAMVGSRKSTGYGISVANQIAGELAAHGSVVVSGLAYGIDGQAHRAALEAGGLTVAVLGGGFRQLYPAAHAHLAEEIVKRGGAVISEYAPDMAPLPQQFAVRNRIIAGLCQVTIVVEAAVKSGSLITATMAMENGRDVMAIPGNIDQPTSEGTNALIRQGAHILTSVQDVYDLLGITAQETKASVYKPASPAEKVLVDQLLAGIHDGQELLESSSLDPSTFSMTLTTLEIQGVIRSGGANTWYLK